MIMRIYYSESFQREIQSIRKSNLGRNEERRSLPNERVARTQSRACVYLEAYSRKDHRMARDENREMQL